MKSNLLNQMWDMAKLVDAKDLTGLSHGLKTLLIDYILIQKNLGFKTMGNPTNHQLSNVKTLILTKTSGDRAIQFN